MLVCIDLFPISDRNEKPSEIFLSPNNVKENPEEGRLVGRLSAIDEDFDQEHQFTLLDSARGRFKLVNNSEIRVALSNKMCLVHGAGSCQLNYEKKPVHTIRVRATDDGTPPLQKIMNLNITLDDVNDQPRDLVLSKYWVKENVALNTTVGYFNASDEDGQQLNFTLVDVGRALFRVDPDSGQLYVAKPINHEESSVDHVTVRVSDNGVPVKWVSTPVDCRSLLLSTEYELNRRPPLFICFHWLLKFQ